MAYESELRQIRQRINSKISAHETVVHTLRGEIEAVRVRITKHDEMVNALRQHLASFELSGPTTLEHLLGFRAAQATVKRKLAEEEMQHAESVIQAEQLQNELKLERKQLLMLQHRHEKIENRINALRKTNLMRMHNLNDNDNEELLNWQM